MTTTDTWTRTCTYDGCGREFILAIKPGRPSTYCPLHRGWIWRQRQYADRHREVLNARGCEKYHAMRAAYASRPRAEGA